MKENMRGEDEGKKTFGSVYSEAAEGAWHDTEAVCTEALCDRVSRK